MAAAAAHKGQGARLKESPGAVDIEWNAERVQAQQLLVRARDVQPLAAEGARERRGGIELVEDEREQLG